MIIVAMLNYGESENYDGETYFGWSEFPYDFENGSIPREVVAYMPINFDVASISDVRNHFLGE